MLERKRELVGVTDLYRPGVQLFSLFLFIVVVLKDKNKTKNNNPSGTPKNYFKVKNGPTHATTKGPCTIHTHLYIHMFIYFIHTRVYLCINDHEIQHTNSSC